VIEEIVSFLLGLVFVITLGIVLCYWAFPAAPVLKERKLERRIEYSLLVIACVLPLTLYLLF
jgi:multisubunit Na+/H+ antiporter MnhB subunit